MAEAGKSAPKVTWTTKGIDALKVAKRTDFTDPNTPGLVLRITPGGAKTWSFLYSRKGDGTKRRVTIGAHGNGAGKLGLSEARERAATLRAQVIDRQDPAGKVAAIRRAESLDQLLDQYLASHPSPDAAWTKLCRHYFNKDVRPLIGHVKLPDLTRQHIRQVLNAVKDRGAKATVNRTLAALRRALSWALAEDLIAVNPASGIVTNIAETPKDRALSQDEIRQFWNALDNAPIGERTRLALRLVLATGQRPGEVCGARKAEIDLVAGVWTIPQERAKNKQAHIVPLSNLAKDLFKNAMTLDHDSALVFTTRARAKGSIAKPKAMESHALSHALRDSLKTLEMDGAPFTPHDLRRTVATHMARLGISDRTVGKVLNHGTELRRTITARVYIQHDFMAEKKAALDAWAVELEQITRPKTVTGNIVSLRRT
jgi:integrase